MENLQNQELTYQLWAQCADDRVILKSTNSNTYIIKKASDVLADLKLIKAIPPAQLAIIGFIAGQNIGNKR